MPPAAGGFAPNPQPPASGGFAPRPPLASASWGLRPRPPKQPPPLQISGYAPETRQRFWIIHGISSVKHYLSDCGKCALKKAKPIRQLMADFPSFRVTAANKPFKFCGTDYFGPIMYKQNRSLCKAWGLLFTCLCTRCVHVEIVTGLDLNNFILAFSRFVNLRGPVDTFFSDNGKSFCAAEKQLPLLLDSTEFHNSLRKRAINWVRIPPYSPSQAGSWESMVKLIKKALT